MNLLKMGHIHHFVGEMVLFRIIELEVIQVIILVFYFI